MRKDIDIRKCPTCDRRTRANGVKSIQAPGTTVRYGDVCSGCKPPTKKPDPKGNSSMPISRKPLTTEEVAVAQLMRDLSATPAEADELIAMLGLAREVTP